MTTNTQITILLVEDDTELRLILEGMLEEEGYEVLSAESGEMALQLAAENSYDLVITDVKLGGIDGLDTLSELKKGRSELQSLVITGYATEADSVRAISLGVSEYLRKPFKIPDLLRAISKLAEEIQQERQQSDFLDSVQQTVLWSLELLTEKLPQVDNKQLIDTSKLAEKRAIQQNLNQSTATQIRLAVLVASLQKLEPASVPAALLAILPKKCTWLLQRLEEESDSDGLEESIARQALAISLGEVEKWAELESENQDEVVETQDASDSAGKLLALAKALEVSGDLENASLALDRIKETLTTSAQAHLTRARVAWQKGNQKESFAHLEEAHEQSKDLSGRSKLQLEGGLLLHQMGELEKAQEWLENSVLGFTKLENTVELARAKIAFSSTQNLNSDWEPELLEKLLSPGNLEALLGSTSWLYPFLLKREDDSVSRKALQRLTRDMPGQITKYLEQAKEEELLKGLDVIREVGIDGYDDLLQELVLASKGKISKLAHELLSGVDSLNLAPILRIYSLGAMTYWLGDRKVPDKGWTGRKPSYLLTLLAQSPGQFMNQEQLIEWFWPGSSRGNKSLNQALVTIRSTLRTPDWPDKFEFVERRGTTVGLNPEHTIWHDAVVAKEALKQANKFVQSGQEAKAAEHFEQALELDRGEYLETCYDDWALSYRETLKLEFSQGLCTLAEIRLSQSRFQDALAVSQHLLSRDPFHERASKSLMEAFIGLDQALEVLRYFEKLERRMKQEFDLEPNVDLVKLYHLAKLKM